MNGLEALKEIRENVTLTEVDFYLNNYHEELEVIEKELKDYHEIKKIAKRYRFDDLARDTHMTTTDEKYLRLFNAAIPDIQADYRKARAFDIIKEKKVDVGSLLYHAKNDNHALAFYNMGIANEKKRLTQDEFYLVMEALK